MRKAILSLFTLLSLSVSAQGIDGDWKGSLKAGAQTLTMLFSFDQAKQSATMGVVEQGAKDLPLTISVLTQDSVNVSMAQIQATYTARLKDGKLLGTFKQGPYSFPLDLEKGAVEYKRPQTPVAPYPYQTEEVNFKGGSEGVTLAGTLTYPVDYKAGQKVPVVLMVTGSGPQDRNEELFSHQPFLVLADYLARHGVASLRYDDRGVGQSTGNYKTATTLDFAADAQGGIAYLKALKRFSQVGILGHSEGGAIAFIVGKEKSVDFIVSLAGPAGRIDELMVEQLNGLAKANGAPGNVVNTPQEAADLLLKTDQGHSTKQFVSLDLGPYVSATKCPVLALGADNDLNVPPSVNTPCLEKGLAKNKRATIKTYPGLNHLFQHAPKGTIGLAANIEETMSEEVMQDIAEWIKRQNK